MTTIAPYRSPAAPGKNGFAQALRAELTKFRTVRGWIIGALVGVLAMAGVGLLASAGGRAPARGSPAALAGRGTAATATAMVFPSPSARTASRYPTASTSCASPSPATAASPSR